MFLLFQKKEDYSCWNLKRSRPHCYVDGSVRQQTNVITTFIDANNVYGSDDATALALRTLHGGELKSFSELLPYVEGVSPKGKPVKTPVAGDKRAARHLPSTPCTHSLSRSTIGLLGCTLMLALVTTRKSTRGQGGS